MSVADLHAAGKSVDEIAAELGMTRFEVRAELNRVEPPTRGQTFLIPPIRRKPTPGSCKECLAPVHYRGIGRPAELCDNHRWPDKRRTKA